MKRTQIKNNKKKSNQNNKKKASQKQNMTDHRLWVLDARLILSI